MVQVSIITPVYNASRFLMETANTVLEQTLEDWEWILVDDRSKDNSREIMMELAKKDNRIKTFFFDANKGQDQLVIKLYLKLKGSMSLF